MSRKHQLTSALENPQVFFGIIILGLSASLVATQAFGSVPSATNYNVFLGIWILAVAVLGFAASCLSIITARVTIVLDALSVLFTFVGGVVCVASIYFSNLFYLNFCWGGCDDQVDTL